MTHMISTEKWIATQERIAELEAANARVREGIQRAEKRELEAATEADELREALKRARDEQDEKIDRAYMLGYKQASREWRACVSESGNVSEADLQLRAKALAAIREAS